MMFSTGVFQNAPALMRSGVAALMIAVIGATSASAASDATLTIRVGASPNDTASSLFYAVALNYFRRVGLDVQVEPMTSGAAEAAALAGGSIDIAESNVVSTAAAHLRGLPFMYIAPGAVYNSRVPTTLMLCAKNATITSGKDLNGKTLGVVALHDLSQLGAVAWVDRTGGDSATLRYLEMPAAELGAAIARGTIAAAVVPEPALRIALTTGDVKVCSKAYDAIASTFMLNGWITTSDYVKAHPDAVRKFRSAVLAAGIWGNANHQASAKIFQHYSKAPPAIIDTMARATFADRFAPEMLQPVINAAAKYQFVDKAIPATDIMSQ